jgi:hypothetical protein
MSGPVIGTGGAGSGGVVCVILSFLAWKEGLGAQRKTKSSRIYLRRSSSTSGASLRAGWRRSIRWAAAAASSAARGK